MKVKCIDNTCYRNWLTIGKNYEVINELAGLTAIYCLLIDDKGREDWYPKYYFKPLAEIIKERNDKIDKLLEDES